MKSKAAIEAIQKYNASFPDGLKEHALFVDLAPLFRQLGADSLNQQVQLLLSRLKEALDQANGFQNTHKKQQSEMASLAVDQGCPQSSLGKYLAFWMTHMHCALPASSHYQHYFL